MNENRLRIYYETTSNPGINLEIRKLLSKELNLDYDEDLKEDNGAINFIYDQETQGKISIEIFGKFEIDEPLKDSIGYYFDITGDFSFEVVNVYSLLILIINFEEVI